MRTQIPPKHPAYTYLKGNVYYFSRAIPADLKNYYSKPRVIQSLRTTNRRLAVHSSRLLSVRLEDYWHDLRLRNTEPPCAHLLTREHLQGSSTVITLTQALELYLSVKGVGRADMFFRTARRNIDYVVDCLADRPLDMYKTSDAAQLRQWLLEKGLSISSVQRTFGVVRAVTNFAIAELGLGIQNNFIGIYLPTMHLGEKRRPIPTDKLIKLQKQCLAMDDDIRWLVALISDTGMRLAEASGLLIEDINLQAPTPYINLRPHSHRPLKTQASTRHIPLIGVSLWAAKRVCLNRSSGYCFPRYNAQDKTSSNSASAAINKWLKSVVGSNSVVHSLRHNFRDRLREVEAPSDMIDQIGGWSLKTVGQNYGDGYRLKHTGGWMEKISLKDDS
ncbi:tyrosine-type recombinase/integrase [Oceanospirillaceae bacterium]|nr:tyrosine-type recombinase/integrase [Oceanospirillaceae bacterium]